MSDVPTEILQEILTHLSGDTLMRLRCVCKAWCRAIDDPFFVRMQTTKHQHSNSSTILIKESKCRRLYSLSLDSLSYADNAAQTIEVAPVRQLICGDVPRLPDLPVPSCNGLILIHGLNNWVVWNPLTNEFHRVPRPGSDLDLVSCGFGFDYIANDYKVVRVDEEKSGDSPVYKTLVYSLKQACWRRAINDCPYYIGLMADGVYLNGALHWISEYGIVALNLRTEDYSLLPWPPTQDFSFLTRPPTAAQSGHLNALDGCLVMSCCRLGKKLVDVDVWVMKDYGVEESWMKLISINKYELGNVRPVAYMKSQNQLLCQGSNGGVFWFDVANDSMKVITIKDFHGFSACQFFPGSIFRLDDRANYVSGSHVAITKKRKRRTKMARSKTCDRTTLVSSKRVSISLTCFVEDCDGDW